MKYYLQGRQWWQTGDSPWQVLACCMEITDAIRSGDPTKFVTHIPVQQVNAYVLIVLVRTP